MTRRRRVKLRSAGTVTAKRNVVGYKRVAAKGRSERERSLGLSAHDAASVWLKLSGAERERFEREVRSEADLAAWTKRRGQPMS